MDSADANRLDKAREELGWLLNSDELIGVPLVVLANKQDLSGVLSPSVTAAKLDLQSVKGRNWYVQGTNALKGVDLYEAIEEISQLVKEFQATRAI